MAPKHRIEITFLSTMQQVAGRETLWLDVPPGATVARALALLRERLPAFVGVKFVALVNGEPARDQRELRTGDGLFLLPPDAGNG